MHPDGITEAVHAAVPEMLDHFLRADDPVAVKQKIFQKCAFFPGESQRRAIYTGFSCTCVKGNAAASQADILLDKFASGKAADAGFGIELDIQLTKDKIPVVFHDFTLKRVCGGEGKISDYTYEELQQFHLCDSVEKIPKFEDVLKMVDGKVPLIVEFKIERTDLSLCPLADKMLRAYKGMYCMESFNPLGVRWYRKKHPDLVRGQLSDAFLKEGEYVGILYFVLQNLLLNFVTKPDFVAYNHHYPEILSRKLCRCLYHNTAAAWTIKSQKELDEARKHFDIFIFDSFVPEAGK